MTRVIYTEDQPKLYIRQFSWNRRVRFSSHNQIGYTYSKQEYDRTSLHVPVKRKCCLQYETIGTAKRQCTSSSISTEHCEEVPLREQPHCEEEPIRGQLQGRGDELLSTDEKSQYSSFSGNFASIKQSCCKTINGENKEKQSSSIGVATKKSTPLSTPSSHVMFNQQQCASKFTIEDAIMHTVSAIICKNMVEGEWADKFLSMGSEFNCQQSYTTT